MINAKLGLGKGRRRHQRPLPASKCLEGSTNSEWSIEYQTIYTVDITDYKITASKTKFLKPKTMFSLEKIQKIRFGKKLN